MTSVVRASFLISIIFLSACSSNEISNYSGEIYGTSYIIKTTGKPSNDLKEKIDAELNRIANSSIEDLEKEVKKDHNKLMSEV